jgi:hypothetical protein
MGTFGEAGRRYGTQYSHAQEATGAIRPSGERLRLLISIPRHASRPPGVVSHHARRRLWLRGHGSWVGTPPPTSWRVHKAATQEIEARAPDHLALEHLEAIDMPLHRARTLREGHTSFDGVVVLLEPLGKALHGLQRASGRALQPRIEAFGLPLARECRKVLGQVDGFGHVGLLGA